MVVYSASIPYSVAEELGAIQERILAQLSESVTSADEVDLKHAETLIDGQFTPEVARYGINLESDVRPFNHPK